MCSHWSAFEEADTAARRAHARRIAAIAELLDIHPETTLVSMISSRSQVSAKTAREWVREAADLRRLPDLAEASARGELSGDQVAALRVLAEDGSDGAWVECLATDDHDFRINHLQRMARREVARTLERTDGGRYLTMTPTRDERFVRGRFQLHPEEAAALEGQLDARVPDGTRLRDYPSAHADALVQLVADAASARGDRAKTTVLVRTDARVLEGTSDAPGELANGTFVPAPVVRHLADHGKVVEVAPPTVDPERETDDIPAATRRWVYHRDQGHCRGIDCTTPTFNLETHHMVPRSGGGTHHPSNLILVCVICHQIKIHRHGWQVVGDAEGEITWIRPDGSIDKPPPIIRRARSPSAS